MPTETFRAIASLKAYADMDQLLQSTGVARQSASDVTLICGTIFNGTFYLNHGVFVRYEIDIPHRSKILGVKLHYTVSGTATTAGPWLLTGGWTVRQSSNAWNDAGGVTEWVNDTDIPFGEANYSTGVAKNPSNFYGGAAAFEDLSCVKGGSALSEWSIGAGTLTGNIGNDTSGRLVSQLQSYLDDPLVEATRGVDTEEGSTYISALFQLYQSYDHSDSTVDHVDVTSCDHSNTIYHPSIDIEWRSAGNLKARSALGKTFESKESVVSTFKARAKVESTLKSRREIK